LVYSHQRQWHLHLAAAAAVNDDDDDDSIWTLSLLLQYYAGVTRGMFGLITLRPTSTSA